MRTLNLKKLFCTIMLLSVVSSCCHAQVPAQALERIFLQEIEEQLSKNLPAVYSNVSVVIANGLEKTAVSYAQLGTPKIQALTTEQVWPDRQEARIVLSYYLKHNQDTFTLLKPEEPGYVQIAVGLTPEKYIYKRLLEEETLYQPEIQAAVDIFTKLHSAPFNHTVDSPEMIQMAQEFINTKVVSADLRQYLSIDLQRGFVDDFLTDVVDYYGIGGFDEAEAAISFFQRYPHGRTLTLKRALHSPFAPRKVKEQINAFLQKDVLSRNELDVFRKQLKRLFRAQKYLLASVTQAPSINQQKQVLMNFSSKLEDFLAKNGHMPRWNSSDVAERHMALDWETIYRSQANDNFGALHVYYNELDGLLEKFGIEKQRFYE